MKKTFFAAIYGLATILFFSLTFTSCTKKDAPEIPLVDQLGKGSFEMNQASYESTTLIKWIIVQPDNQHPVPITAEFHINSGGGKKTSLLYTEPNGWNTITFQATKTDQPDKVTLLFTDRQGEEGVYVCNSIDYCNLSSDMQKIVDWHYTGDSEDGNTGYYTLSREFFSGVYTIEKLGRGFTLFRELPNGKKVIFDLVQKE